jgi:hypothetical protein
MMKTDLQEKLERLLGDDEIVLLADGFEEAFVGIGRQFGRPLAVYDRAKCIEILTRELTEAEAEEYFQFNTEGAYVGEQTPIFLEL